MWSLQHNSAYIQSLVTEIIRVTEKALGASASSVLLIDVEREELCFKFVQGSAEGLLNEASLGTETGIAGWVARHGEPLIINDVTKDDRFCSDIDDITGFATKSILCAPLQARGNTIGVIEVLNKKDGSEFDERDLQTLMAVARTATTAIELKLAEDAIRDSEDSYSRLIANLNEREIKLFDLDPCAEREHGA
jgi:sigma-B regulation protein RsbU (phosphoserine phosphatase)